MSIKKKCKKIILIAGVAAMATVPQFAFADCTSTAGNWMSPAGTAAKTAATKCVQYSVCRNVANFCRNGWSGWSGWYGSCGTRYPNWQYNSGNLNCGNSCSPDDQNSTGNAGQNGSESTDGTGDSSCGSAGCTDSDLQTGCSGTTNGSCESNAAGDCGSSDGCLNGCENGGNDDAANTGSGSSADDNTNGTDGNISENGSEKPDSNAGISAGDSGTDSNISGGSGSANSGSTNSGSANSGSTNNSSANSGSANSGSNSGSQDSTASSYASQVADIVNQERVASGLSTLSYDSSLARLAQLKAEDMAKNNYFSHQSPTYGSAFDMMKTYGVSYSSAGENIARGQKTPSAVMDSWMNSSGHRANILSSSYSSIGVGYAVDSSGRAYWVQMFKG